ncbi:putative deoxyribonuclease TATDN2 [Montipora foliosa]|uniref:putative deoxyribonuclease TATDN2 n=1 Tax=Montipora foliosa TaxID=591990 RepID=UPI0035F1A385
MDEKKCFKCGKTGHMKRDCPEKASSNLQRVKCFACGRHGHFQRDCPNMATGDRKDEKGNTTKASGRSNTEVSYPDCKETFIDTHCHLEYVFERARHDGTFQDFKKRVPFPPNFEGCITTFCDPAAFSSFGTWREVLSEEGVWGTFGCHPHNAKYYNDDLEAKIIQCLEHPKAIALGEVGLDYSSHSASPPDIQKEVFAKQANWAVTLEKPLVVHCRDAESDTLEILQACVPTDWRIHMHCFTGSSESVAKFCQHFPNLFIGITALVTFAKAKNVHELAFDTPMERLLLETDAPYFMPSQVGDKHNKWSNPGMAIFTAQRIAEIKRISIDNVLEKVRSNTTKMYGV